MNVAVNAATTDEHALPLTVVYQGWDRYQRDLLKAIAPLSPERLALPVAATHWPIGMLVQSIHTTLPPSSPSAHPSQRPPV